MKMIRRMKKGIAALLIMGTVGMGLYMTADAGQTVTGCSHDKQEPEIYCTSVHEYQAGGHAITVGSNLQTCYESRVAGVHTKKCSKCGELYETFDARCYVIHSNPNCTYYSQNQNKLCGGH